MPAVVTRVFLSSTVGDLKRYRKAVRQAIARMEGYQCVGMEDFGSRPDTPVNVCCDKVKECDIFVGLVGTLYGSNPPDNELSFTEIEYQAAIEFEKPRLMFVAPENISLPYNLREPDDRKKRQDEFRRTVRADLVSDSFRKPAELAALVTTAITNLERKKAGGGLKEFKVAQKKVKAGRQKPAPNPSKNVPRMCDRIKQEADFDRYLGLADEYRPGFPLAFMVHGEYSENHKSFIQRLCDTKIQKCAKARAGKQRGSVKHVVLHSDEWPHAYDRASRQGLLKSYVFGKLAPHYRSQGGKYPAADLRKLLEQSLSSVVVFEHKIKAEHWDGETAALLHWYLEFWDEVKGAAALPQCFIFFKVVYPDTRRGGLWNIWRGLRRANPLGINGRVRRAARRICSLPERAIDPGRVKEPERAEEKAAAHCALALLDELTCVEKEHVVEWLSDHLGIDDEGEIERSAVDIMTDEQGRFRKCRNMREVESQLNEKHRRTTSAAVRT